MWYFIVAAVFGIIFEHNRPEKYDDISLWVKIMVPVVAGLLWPAIVVKIIITMIKEYWT